MEAEWPDAQPERVFSNAILLAAEIAMAPDRYADEFTTAERAGVFYADRSDWRASGVQITALSHDGLRRSIAALVGAEIDRARRFDLVWC